MDAKEMIIRGKTVQDALLIARETLGVDEDQLQVEVLGEGQQGFLGLLRRPAVIRVTVHPPNQSHICQNQDNRPDCDGTVEVRYGALYVCDAIGNGKPAVITPTPEVILRVNGVTVIELIPIHENDEIELDFQEEVYPAQIEIEIPDDCLTAHVKVTPQITIYNKLMDQDSQSMLELLTESHEVQTKTITPDQIKKALKDKGVVFGLDHSAIGEASEAADGVSKIVARGKPVQQGRNGFVEYLFDSDPVKIVYDEDERADYWERYIFPSVKKGDVLAVLHPADPGVVGMKVTGEEIPPEPVYEDVIRAKDGVKISDNGQEAIATISGRPLIEGSGITYLRVTQLMTHPGDVDMTSGNLRFWGDLLILGNVTGGMQVSALGDVTVKGNVTGATIRAGSKVVCQGSVIKSEITAGGLTTLYNQLASLVGELGTLIDDTIREATEVHEHLLSSKELRTGSDGRLDQSAMAGIVRLIIKKKAKSIETLINEYSVTLDTTDLPFPPVINEFIQTIKELTDNAGNPDCYSLEALGGILEKKQEVTYLLESLPDRPNDIVCNYVQNSNFEAAGDINVTDKGGFYSNLRAGRDVSVRGVFRGGEILADGNVSVNEAGSPRVSSGDVKIKVAGESTVKIHKAFPETIVQVGNRSHYVKKEQACLKVQLGTNGDIVLETFSA